MIMIGRRRWLPVSQHPIIPFSLLSLLSRCTQFSANTSALHKTCEIQIHNTGSTQATHYTTELPYANSSQSFLQSSVIRRLVKTCGSHSLPTTPSSNLNF